jgi:adenylylsulfate kinase-like enzyme
VDQRRSTVVLLLAGPAGVGKTTVGWQLYSELSAAGVPVGYLDLDQVGMCYPEPSADPGRHRIQTRNLNAVVAGFRAAGAPCVIASGIVDAVAGVDRSLLESVALTVCRLRVGPDELVARFVGRGGSGSDAEAETGYASDLEHSTVADLVVDTDGRSVGEVVRLVRERALARPFGGAAASSVQLVDSVLPSGPSSEAGRVLWLSGVTGVGKSTVGWPVYEHTRQAGHRAALVDLGQLGFGRPVPADDPGRHRLKALNLAAVWQNYREVGADRLVVVGDAPDRATVDGYLNLLPPRTVTLVRMHVGAEQLTRQILLRQAGGSWVAPGDPLKGRPREELLRVARSAVAEDAALERDGLGDLRVDVDGCTVEQAAAAIITAVGDW